MAKKYHKKFTLLFLICFYNTITMAQNNHLSIGSKTVGVGFGNSKKYNGIRFNAIDKSVEKLNGVVLSGISKSKIINGLNLGLYIQDSVSNGVTISPIFTYSQRLNGINFGGIGCGGDYIQGLSTGSLLFVNSKISGVGISLISIADSMQGLFFSIGGTFARSDMKEGNLEGIITSVYVNRLYTMKGICIGMMNDVKHQNGVTIGVSNKAEKLRGIQIGLWNVALNKKILKRMPLFNMNFTKKGVVNINNFSLSDNEKAPKKS